MTILDHTGGLDILIGHVRLYQGYLAVGKGYERYGRSELRIWNQVNPFCEGRNGKDFGERGETLAWSTGKLIETPIWSICHWQY